MRQHSLLTQGEVAKKLNVDQAAISHWESGTNAPLRKYRKKLAKIYGVTVDELETALGGETV